MTRAALLLGPLAMTAYGITRIIGRLDDQYGPGADWQLAHLFGLAGMLLFIPIIRHLRAHTRPGPLRETVTAATLLGLAASIIQFSADITQAAIAADRTELRSLQHGFTDLPGVQLAIYDIGPQLFFIGIVILAALTEPLPWWSPVLLLTAVLLAAVDLNLLPLTGLLMLAALHPLTRQPTPLPTATR
ncbi:hypothetical protein Aca07nite_55010 [Actinoplanes capillaceus]|uniref:Uncharacterized protein n=1 Tax=Actinoplanes campanulatus TaxID=113559 RepID=A0ABQ3WPN3_9ACTN|nr:hypothetical protein [Actinoplanes capillaceus]GID48226.1 hypothetical protein Aca07nite_55010 [Actinoplanes capillaceus]